jgi:hypothetical protein
VSAKAIGCHSAHGTLLFDDSKLVVVRKMLKFQSRPWIIGLFICSFAMPAWAQGNEMSLDDAVRGYEATTHQTFQGVVDDWSTHHVVFSRPEPGSETEYRIQQDGRYWLQQIKDKMPAAAAISDLGLQSDFRPPPKKKKKKPKKSKLKNDWSVNMGTGANVGAGQYPAKFQLRTGTAPLCTDYVVFNTGIAGATAVAATGTGTFANDTSAAGNAVVINGVTLTATGIGTDTITAEPASAATTVIDGVTYTWTTTTCSAFTPSTTAGCVVRTGTAATNATNLEEAIDNTCSAVTACKVSTANPGATATTNAAAIVIVTNTTAGAITWTESSAQTLSPTGSISAASTSGLNFALSTNTTTAASNLATAINNNTGTDDVTATSSGAVVTVTATTAGTAGNSITTTETMAGFSWGGTTLAGGAAGQATILAFNNLYATTCSGTVPLVDWAYNTGTGATAVTAVALSPDGTQVAFIQSSSAGVASLVLLKWKASSGTLAAPIALTAVATTAYPTCTAPCMTTIAFGDGHNDTNSFPFYDYSGSDQLFAGDDSGDLHKFQHVFNGTASTPPAEVTTGGFPATVASTGLALSTPVYDPNTTLAFVGEAHVAGATTDGHFHSVSSTGTVTTSGPATDALCHGVGFTEGPLLDPSAGADGTVYIGCDHDVGGDTCGNGDNACLRQFAENGVSGGIGLSVTLGTQADAEMFAGAFDYLYLTSTAPTGSLYFCGNPGGTVSLYRIPITSNVMGTPVLVHALSTTSNTAGTEGSPITEFYNRGTSTDWLFMSEPNTADMAVGTCTTTSTGCVYSYNVTTAPVAGATATAGLASTDGSSGIIVDNSSTATGASQVYFSTLGNGSCGGGCAIQAAQSTL